MLWKLIYVMLPDAVEVNISKLLCFLMLWKLIYVMLSDVVEVNLCNAS